MNSLNDNVELAVGYEPHAVPEAALIWARATAVRDQRPEPATGDDKIPGIHRRLRLQGAMLLLARRNGKCVGFTLFAPREESLEIFYLAVDPDSWGSSVASALLIGAENHAHGMGRASLELWVINDNERALGVYARAGFVDAGQVKRDESSGQIERRLVKQI